MENADAIVGAITLQARVPGTRIAIRADAATNGKTHSATVGAGFGWFAGRKN
jgi:hypothetical protein